MRILSQIEAKTIVNKGRTIEKLIKFGREQEYPTVSWFAIEKSSDGFDLLVHEVFLEYDELESVYDFSYVEPDDLYGKKVATLSSVEEVFNLMNSQYGVEVDGFTQEGDLDNIIKEKLKS